MTGSADAVAPCGAPRRAAYDQLKTGPAGVPYTYIYVHGGDIATKTITVDVEAYNRLKKVKRKDESFSQVIKRVVPAPIDFDEWVRKMESDPVSDQFVEAVEQRIANRGRPSSRER